jgi:hypothetical protein
MLTYKNHLSGAVHISVSALIGMRQQPLLWRAIDFSFVAGNRLIHKATEK